MAAPRVLFIVGPTASGKTAASLQLAARTRVEIVNADSRQVYRGMSVGTGKPAPAELASVPHHLIDVAAPDERNKLARFITEARTLVERINAEEGPLFSLIASLDSAAQAFESEMSEMQLDQTTASFRRTTDSVTDLALDARGISRELQEDLIILREALESIRQLTDMLERDPSALIHGKSGG